MAVDEGKFRLYSFIDPPLPAGDYRFRADQLLSGMSSSGRRDADALPIEQLDTHVRIRAPRYQLPPDQVLSTFPPASSEGAYGSLLPQIVIKRRTLPWERDLAGQPSTTPWLALVLIAEGEAELVMNQPVSECVTPGITLSGVVDSQLGNYLKIRKSVIDRVFPTRKDVPLLVHAREVDLHDTELMMGDDDGFLAVVVSNRLPVAGRDASGAELPVKYLACLVNLEEQFETLLPEAPPPSRFSDLSVLADLAVDVAGWDHIVSGHGMASLDPSIGVGPAGPVGPDGRPVALVEADGLAVGGDAAALRAPGPAASPKPRLSVEAPGGAAVYPPTRHWSIEEAIAQPVDVYQDMARDFGMAGSLPEFADFASLRDPVHRFPVLLHWSFTSSGDTTFRSLMEGLDSALITSQAEPARPTPAGRSPLEVVETGHVGITHRTRRGDQVRAWYRGPLVPHPTTHPRGGRLALAHAADQVRIVVPDGREDLSLAAAFEIGRLLAMSRPAIVSSLMRWRQQGYLAARRRSLYAINAALLDDVLGWRPDLDEPLPHVRIGRAFVRRASLNPADLLGPPRPMFDPGRPLDLDRPERELLASGFALDPSSLTGTLTEMLDRLRATEVTVAGQRGDQPGESPGPGLFAGLLSTRTIAARLRTDLDRQLLGMVSDTFAARFDLNPVVGPAMPRTQPAPPRSGGAALQRDRLDQWIAEGRFAATDTERAEAGEGQP